MSGARKLLVAVALVAAMLPVAAHADDASYIASVQRAQELVTKARDGNPAAARQAAAELRQGTGDTQPEILADLAADPPDLDDAAVRLQALSSALQAPAGAADPAFAHRQMDSVLADHRYDSLRAAPNPIDLFLAWLLGQLAALLSGGLTLTSFWNLVLVLAGALLVGGVATWLLIALRGRARRGAVAPTAWDRRRAAIDHFSEADRLAAAGDLGAAVRELAAAVAVRLGGDEAWDSSPLTVRELFKRAGRPDALRPLLLGFERAAYAGQAPDLEDYGRAAAAAEPYRPREAAA